MKRILLTLVFLLILFGIVPKTGYAIYNPLATVNNDIGIHILFPEELHDAVRLVNSSGGDWGYVTIPIQVGDKDLEKWQTFMNTCYELHLIPILRLSTEAHYKATDVWRQPTQYDILDFGNFLNSLNWPTKNRYVILFNEINRSDEWEGKPPDPEGYADLVEYAVDVFKRRSNDFFVILGGLDSAAPNDGVKYLNSFEFLKRMYVHKPTVFQKIDGFSSHSYPNPNFVQPPQEGKVSIASYKYESEYIHSVTGEKKPVFITETGWNGDMLSQSTIAKYYTDALNTIWNDQDTIVAITPFLLRSQGGGFDKFSFIKNGNDTDYFKAVQNFPKKKGEPVLNILPVIIPSPASAEVLGTKNFKNDSTVHAKFSPVLKGFLKILFGYPT